VFDIKGTGLYVINLSSLTSYLYVFCETEIKLR